MQSASSLPSVEVHRHPDRTILRFTGCNTLDEYNSPALSQQLCRLPEIGADETLLVDLGGIRYASSTGLGLLVALNQKTRSAGGRLLLANVGPLVQEVLALTCLAQVLGVLPNERSSLPTACRSA
jgi:anti-anti-sigma factor